MVLVIAFAIRGLFRGFVAQVFGVLGLIAGLWAAGWVSQWVGWQWHAARPAVVFVALRWLVVALAGLTVSALFQWVGAMSSDAIGKTPLALLDRPVGALFGIVVGGGVACIALLVALLIPAPHALRDAAARARVSRPLMTAGSTLCTVARPIPGSRWLHQRFLAARARTIAPARPS